MQQTDAVKSAGMPPGIPPEGYRHGLLLERFRALPREASIRRLCRDHGVSYATFYDAVNGRIPVSKRRLELVAQVLGLTLEEVLI